jgi:hypothetical protein
VVTPGRTLREGRARIAAPCVATAIGSLGLAAGGTAGGPLVTAINGDRALAGVPVALLVIGSAAAALWAAAVWLGGAAAVVAIGVARTAPAATYT